VVESVTKELGMFLVRLIFFPALEGTQGGDRNGERGPAHTEKRSTGGGSAGQSIVKVGMMQ
jgi:hypothetical protein